MMIDYKDIIGLYTVVDEATFRPRCRLVIVGETGQFMKSPILNMSVEMVQDLKAYMPKEEVEVHVTSMILQEFKQEQYTIMSEVDISAASKQIKYLERMILRETKINEILK
jgi:hypothetical protein